MNDKCLGILLAGGLARRMGGGDKCRQLLKNKSLLELSIERAQSQVSALILNANGDPGRFDDVSLPIVPDCIEGFAGPLAGVLTGMEWAETNQADCQWVMSFATDTPFFPLDIVERLMKAAIAEDSLIAVAESEGRLQPVFALWHRSLAPQLRTALVDEGVRKIDRWMALHPMSTVSFDDEKSFFNINRPEDMEIAKRL